MARTVAEVIQKMWIPRPRWFPTDITKTSGSDTDSIHSHGPQASLQPWAAAWNIDINMATGGIVDHSGPLRRSSLKSETFLISDLHCCPDPGGFRVRVALGAESVSA